MRHEFEIIAERSLSRNEEILVGNPVSSLTKTLVLVCDSSYGLEGIEMVKQLYISQGKHKDGL